MDKMIPFMDWPGKYSSMDSMTFMGSPFPLLLIICSYLYFVLFMGPKMMELRRPMNIRIIILPYNILQAFLFSYIVLEMINNGFSFELTWKCVVENGEDMNELHNNMWLFMILRIFELFETIFVVLRKKRSQLTFLHIYHQTTSVLVFWILLKYHSGMMEIFLIVISSIGHVIKTNKRW
ncbi:CLUMA_CG012461, isoform A [Clunio marinus]|uniref:Elongation of very long chain fatty acids protein n=1 Tax=Clunio marinus TaxID=568069 RepID=A0A1J1IEW6_9DIPT|nr:CLUMA_CG012461, isoform A [Clunio marinus]